MGNEIFGLDEEKREEAEVETLKSVRKPYVTWAVGKDEYKLKLTTSAIVKIEEKYRKNLLILVTEEGLPPVGVLLTIVHAAMAKYHHGIKGTNVLEIYDEYVDNGGDITQLMSDVILPLLENAGFFTREVTEELQESLN